MNVYLETTTSVILEMINFMGFKDGSVYVYVVKTYIHSTLVNSFGKHSLGPCKVVIAVKALVFLILAFSICVSVPYLETLSHEQTV